MMGMIRLLAVSIFTGLGLGIGFALPIVIGGYILIKKFWEEEE